MDDRYPSALPAGTRFGEVELLRPIGMGAWGIVYEGRHDRIGRVAVKEYFPSTYASRQSRGGVSSNAPQWQEAVRRGLERFSNEGRTLQTIRHEHVVAVHDFIEDDGVALLVMEFVDGVPLSAALEAGRFTEPASVMQLGKTLAETLAAIHSKNVLHRDIAPDNIMLRAGDNPVLIDFGGAGAAIASVTRSSQNIVKDGYSPPEQYDSSQSPAFPIGPWSDIYSVAAVLYRLMSGREPAVANARMLAAGMKNATDPLTPLAQVAPAGYPAHFIAAVDAGLALMPGERPQSARAWRALFEAPPAKAKPNMALRAFAGVSAALAIGFGVYAFAPHAGQAPVAPTSAPTSAPTTVSTAQPTSAATPEPIFTFVHPVMIFVCPNGYTDRLASPSDAVCVTAAQHAQALDQNNLASSRRNPQGGVYGSATCLQGYVWRAAFNGDEVCVTGAERDEAAAENANAPSKIRRPI